MRGREGPINRVNGSVTSGDEVRRNRHDEVRTARDTVNAETGQNVRRKGEGVRRVSYRPPTSQPSPYPHPSHFLPEGAGEAG